MPKIRIIFHSNGNSKKTIFHFSKKNTKFIWLLHLFILLLHQINICNDYKFKTVTNMNTFEYLLEHNIKPSVQRMAIMSYLDSHRTHPTADEIFNALSTTIPTLSKTTIYNTLKLFVQEGVAQSISIDEKNEHFDANTAVHAHFLCRKCNKIYDAFIKSRKLPGEIELKEEGHKIDEAYIYYRGLCSECIKEELKKQKD